MDHTKAFYSIGEFASLMGVCWRTIYRAIKQGHINAFRISGGEKSAFRIPSSEIQRLAEMEKIKREMK